jgi:hypothetical protein
MAMSLSGPILTLIEKEVVSTKLSGRALALINPNVMCGCVEVETTN